MPRHSKPADPETLRLQLVELLGNFKTELRTNDLRRKVCALVPAFHRLRDLGCSLMPNEEASSARDRIIAYFRKFPGVVLSGDELMVVSGIGEWARRLRELRVEMGWSIASGVTLKDTLDEIDEEERPAFLKDLGITSIKPDQYILLKPDQDRDAAHRWNIANQIRKKKSLSIRDKILEFFKANIGKEITNEELRYVSGNKSEWARRVRELRTEEGWSVVTKTTGRPDLPVGVYVLIDDRQQPPHDRHIPDGERAAALKRDKYTCQDCGWNQGQWNSADPRHLELHHLKSHVEKGENIAANLLVVCNRCHDERHRRTKTIK